MFTQRNFKRAVTTETTRQGVRKKWTKTVSKDHLYEKFIRKNGLIVWRRQKECNWISGLYTLPLTRGHLIAKFKNSFYSQNDFRTNPAYNDLPDKINRNCAKEIILFSNPCFINIYDGMRYGDTMAQSFLELFLNEINQEKKVQVVSTTPSFYWWENNIFLCYRNRKLVYRSMNQTSLKIIV